MKDGEMSIYKGWTHFIPECDVCGGTEEPMLLWVPKALLCDRCEYTNPIYICKKCVLEAVKLIKEGEDDIRNGANRK